MRRTNPPSHATSASRSAPRNVTPVTFPGQVHFLIANHAVIVPQYGTESQDLAVAVLQSLFADRKVIGLPSTAILTGGGSFHCISQQEPA